MVLLSDDSAKSIYRLDISECTITCNVDDGESFKITSRVWAPVAHNLGFNNLIQNPLTTEPVFSLRM
jgi:hypothetical protein